MHEVLVNFFLLWLFVVVEVMLVGLIIDEIDYLGWNWKRLAIPVAILILMAFAIYDTITIIWNIHL